MSQAPTQQNPAAMIGLTSGVVAVAASVFFSIVIGGVLALVALLSGNYGLQQANKGKDGKGMAIAAIVLAFISIAINIIVPNLD